MSRRVSERKCNCNEERPAFSGTSVHEDSSTSQRPTLENQGFELVPPGAEVDRHDCWYVEKIKALIPKAIELALEEDARVAAEKGLEPDAKGPSAKTFHKWMDFLAESKGLRKAVDPALKAGWVFRRGGFRNGKWSREN